MNECSIRGALKHGMDEGSGAKAGLGSGTMHLRYWKVGGVREYFVMEHGLQCNVMYVS